MTNNTYTCFSTAHQGCGALHATKAKAIACCSLHAKKFDEHREPVSCDSREALEAHYPASDEAQARRDEYLAKRKKASDRDKPSSTAGSTSDSASDPLAAAEAALAEAKANQQDADGQGAKADQDAGADSQDSQAQPQSQGQTDDDSDGEGEHPLQRLATDLDPLMAPMVLQRIQPALDSFADAVAAANKPTDHEVDKLKQEQRTLVEGAKALITSVTDALDKIDEAKQVQVTVNKPDGSQHTVKGEAHQMFPLLLKLIAAGENVYMAGPAGSGKTTAAKMVCDALDLDLIVQPVAMDKFEATGFIDAGGSYRESAVYKWAKADKPSLLLLDEVDGWLPQALVALNPILDNRLGIFPGGQQFDISQEHRVIATANTWGSGPDAEYVGRNRLDAASLDRFGARLDWGYDEKFETKLLKAQFGKQGAKAAKASQRVRKNLAKNGVKILWGPRQTIGLARRLSAGLSLREAFEVSSLASLSESNRERNLQGVDLDA